MIVYNSLYGQQAYVPDIYSSAKVKFYTYLCLLSCPYPLLFSPLLEEGGRERLYNGSYVIPIGKVNLKQM